MKKVFFIILITFFNILSGQSVNDSIKLEIVKDLTKEYIESIELSEEDQKSYDKFTWDETKIEDLKSNLSNNNFSNTSIKITGELYGKIDYNNSEEKVVEDVKKYLKNSLSDKEIKDVLKRHKEDEVQMDETESAPIENSPTKKEDKTPWYMWGIIIFLLLLIGGMSFFLYDFYTKKEKRLKRIKEKEKIIDELLRNQQQEEEQKNSRGESIDLEKKIEDLRKENEELKIEIERLKNPEGAMEVSFEPPEVEKTEVLYLDKGLKSVSEESPHKLYKLLEIEPNKFEFEVYENLSQYVINEVTNFPDDTLYNACDNYNSNLDFRNTITTVKKGVIVKEGDLYEVKEKALIKFE